MKTATELIEQAEKYCDEQWGSGEIVAQQAYIAGYQQALEDMREERGNGLDWRDAFACGKFPKD